MRRLIHFMPLMCAAIFMIVFVFAHPAPVFAEGDSAPITHTLATCSIEKSPFSLDSEDVLVVEDGTYVVLTGRLGDNFSKMSIWLQPDVAVNGRYQLPSGWTTDDLRKATYHGCTEAEVFNDIMGEALIQKRLSLEVPDRLYYGPAIIRPVEWVDWRPYSSYFMYRPKPVDPEAHIHFYRNTSYEVIIYEQEGPENYRDFFYIVDRPGNLRDPVDPIWAPGVRWNVSSRTVIGAWSEGSMYEVAYGMLLTTDLKWSQFKKDTLFEPDPVSRLSMPLLVR